MVKPGAPYSSHPNDPGAHTSFIRSLIISWFMVAERTNHQQGHWPVPGGGDVQRGQLRPASGGAALLRTEVDDTQLDQAPKALKP